MKDTTLDVSRPPQIVIDISPMLGQQAVNETSDAPQIQFDPLRSSGKRAASTRRRVTGASTP